MRMDDDAVRVIGTDPRSTDIFVSAAHGTNGQSWPPLINHDGKTYKFACNEVMTQDTPNVGGLARYTLLSAEPAMEMRLCEQNFVTLRPNKLYYFTVDPDCENCLKIAKLYENQ